MGRHELHELTPMQNRRVGAFSRFVIIRVIRVKGLHELALEYRLKANDQKPRDRQKMTVEAMISFAIRPQGWSNDLASTRAGTFETTTTGTIQLKMNLNSRGKIESG